MTMLYVYRFLYIKDVIYVCIIYIHTQIRVFKIIILNLSIKYLLFV